MPGREDNNHISVGDETAPTNNTGDIVQEVDNADGAPLQHTLLGRAVCAPLRLISKIDTLVAQGQHMATKLQPEYSFYSVMMQLDKDLGKLACMATVKGMGLRLLAQCWAASADKDKWIKAMEEEHDRMVHQGVWKAVPPSEVPDDAKIITSTWANKKKSNGTYCARLNAWGFQLIPGVHYAPKSVAAPVTNNIPICIVMVLMLMAMWFGELLDVKGAFLHDDFGQQEKPLHMCIPQVMEKFYPLHWILLLLKTIYGPCQSAYAFWHMFLLSVFRSMGFKRSKANSPPCLYFAWTKNGLCLWVSWVEDCLVVGMKEAVAIAKKQLMAKFDCDKIGNMDEYVRCKVDCNFDKDAIKLTQPLIRARIKEYLRS
jgi:hypothetical protein